MGFHTFPIGRADELEDPVRYRFCSREELLEMLDPGPGDRAMDLGSGTGFFSMEVAPFVGSLFAVDLQSAMHQRFREKGLPQNTHLVTSGIAALPFGDDVLDLAFSVDTHHEYFSENAMAELARTIRPGGRLVTIDWSAAGTGEEGPPLEERYGPAAVVDQLRDVGFDIEECRERPETFAVIARR